VKGNQLSVLIVDDEKDAVDLLAYLINDVDGIRISGTALNTCDAKKLIKTEVPDLIFLDIEMPIQTGFDFAEELLKCRHCPAIVFVTAYNHYEEESRKYQPFDFLTKPISRKRLENTIRRFENQKNAERAFE
jgi:two-component SAPR family response regulator